MRTSVMMSAAIALLLCLILFLHWNNKSIVTTEYVYESDRLPKAFDGYRITHVSDLQSEYFGKNQRNLIEKTAKTNPDIIVYTGDLLDRNHTDFDAARTAMEGLLDIAPVYYVNGNHEMAVEETAMNAFYEELEAMGVSVLFDRSLRITKDDAEICLMGLSEHTVFGCKDFIRDNSAPLDMNMLQAALDGLRSQGAKSDFSILLAHEPQYLDAYAAAGFDLAFAGHAHGGQIRLPFTDGLYAPGQGVLPKLASGMHGKEETTLVISRGLGNSTFPFRVFNRPEIITVKLLHGNN
ncbi:MAG: metallophosphoesterase [Firmicutes bacterium]|nr:metallophosphoesterase [Bacillota bacterium]